MTSLQRKVEGRELFTVIWLLVSRCHVWVTHCEGVCVLPAGCRVSPALQTPSPCCPGTRPRPPCQASRGRRKGSGCQSFPLNLRQII